MCYQIIGLSLDIIGVVLLSFGGVFKVTGFQYGQTKDDFRTLWMARIGLLIAIAGFVFQIIGVCQTYSLPR